MKRKTVLLIGLAISSYLLFLNQISKAVVTPSGPPVQGSSIQGNCTDGMGIRCSTYYGSPAVVNSNWQNENANGYGIAGSLNGAMTPANPLDVNGAVEFGGGTAPAANGSVQFKVTPLNASTTGQIINTPASPTADIMEWQVNGSTKAHIGPSGGLGILTTTRAGADALPPDFLGELIQIGNYNGSGSNFAASGLSFVTCVATGTAVDQWQVMNSTGGAGQNGCGANR